jgi:hypothetical protein
MTCDACGLPIASTNPRARYCSTNCRVKASQRRAKGVPELRPAAQVVDARPAAGGLRASVLADLEAAGRDGSPLGLAALALAERIDARADTAAGLAAAVKQMQSTLAEALRGAEAGDILDELSARREARRGA